jgi:hypothetical protein
MGAGDQVPGLLNQDARPGYTGRRCRARARPGKQRRAAPRVDWLVDGVGRTVFLECLASYSLDLEFWG